MNLKSYSRLLLAGILTTSLAGCMEEIKKYQGFYKLKICSEETSQVWAALDLRVRDEHLILKFYDSGSVSPYIFSYENSIGPRDSQSDRNVKFFPQDPNRPLIRKIERQTVAWIENMMWIQNRVFELDDNPENPSQKVVSQTPEYALEFQPDRFTLKFSLHDGYSDSTPPISKWHKFECEYEKN